MRSVATVRGLVHVAKHHLSGGGVALVVGELKPRGECARDSAVWRRFVVKTGMGKESAKPTETAPGSASNVGPRRRSGAAACSATLTA